MRDELGAGAVERNIMATKGETAKSVNPTGDGGHDYDYDYDYLGHGLLFVSPAARR